MTVPVPGTPDLVLVKVNRNLSVHEPLIRILNISNRLNSIIRGSHFNNQSSVKTVQEQKGLATGTIKRNYKVVRRDNDQNNSNSKVGGGL